MPIIPKLECRVETFREDDAVFMRIGIHQEEMLLAYLHDHENGTDCEIVLAPAKLMTDAQISLTVNDIECIKKLLHDCIEQPYYVSWLHDDLTAATKAGEMDLAVYVVGKRNSEVFGKKAKRQTMQNGGLPLRFWECYCPKIPSTRFTGRTYFQNLVQSW